MALQPSGGIIIDTIEHEGDETASTSSSLNPDFWTIGGNEISESYYINLYTIVGASGSVFTFTYKDNLEAFPMSHVDYMQSNGNVVRIPGVDAIYHVPPDVNESIEIISMIEDRKSRIDDSYSITAWKEREPYEEEGETPEGGPYYNTESGTFTIRIWANYDKHRDMLDTLLKERK